MRYLQLTDRIRATLLLVVIGVLSFATVAAQEKSQVPTDMVVVGGGKYIPLFVDPGSPNTVKVDSYYLDQHLISNAQFQQFTSRQTRWSKSGVKPLFADDQYLRHFPVEAELHSDQPSQDRFASVVPAGWSEQPVTNVSWFAARAYCKQQSKRLPTVHEWEYAARASATEVDATGSAEHRSRILKWYGKVATESLPAVTETPRNVWGVHGMHGVVWEMVSDFNSVLVTGESRGDTQLDRDLFCGAGAASSSNPADYAAFMRYALRSSYQASYTLQSLGFRCARSIDIEQ